MEPAPDWRSRVGGAALAIALHAALAAMLALFATRPPATVADDALTVR